MAEDITAAKQASGKTGAVCQESGPYTSSDNPRAAKVIVFLRLGDLFPPDILGGPTLWTLVTEGQRLREGRVERDLQDADEIK